MNDADSLQDYQRVRQQAIRSLFEIVEGSSEGTVIVDREARIVWINQRYAQRFGLADPAQAIGRPCESVIPGSLLREVVGSGKPILLDMMDSAKDPLVVMRLPIHDDAGEVIGAIGFALLDELRSLSPLVTRYLSMQRELASTRSQLQARQAKYSFSHFVGTSPASLEVKRRARRGAASEAPVLLLGETGTGKELLAHAIHSASPRAHKAFVSVNAAAIPESLLEAEFFGTAPGAFTGAERKGRPGKLQVAQGGTLFLDEIGDMPLPMQVKLLRVLQERTFERVGSNKTQNVDVRIIAATHKNLEKMIEDGTFREDLYYRLNVFPIEMAPLRERVEDIALLLNELISRMEHEKRGSIRFNSAAIMSLCRHDWPGNVRELANLVERLAIMHPYGVIGVGELPKKFRHVDDEDEQLASSLREELEERAAINAGLPGMDAPAMLPAEGLDLKDYLANLEQGLIQQALDDAGGVVARAAERLRIRRTTLVEKMRKYGMSRRDDDLSDD